MDFSDHTRTEKEKNALARRKYIKWTLVCGKKTWQDLREMNVSISDGTLPTLKREWVASCHFSLANCFVVNLLVFISQNKRERKGQAPFHNTQIVDIIPLYFLSGREMFIRVLFESNLLRYIHIHLCCVLCVCWLA
jgi:hypothetical protein